MAADVSWLIRQWEDVITKEQFIVSAILQCLIADTIEALKELRELEAPQHPTEGVKKLCDNCGQPIEPVRLKNLPQTNLCLSCKLQEEKKAKDDKGHKQVKQSRASPKQ